MSLEEEGHGSGKRGVVVANAGAEMFSPRHERAVGQMLRECVPRSFCRGSLVQTNVLHPLPGWEPVFL